MRKMKKINVRRIGVNFINVFCALFLYECRFGSFLSTYVCKKSCRNDIRTKKAHKKCWWNWRLVNQLIGLNFPQVCYSWFLLFGDACLVVNKVRFPKLFHWLFAPFNLNSTKIMGEWLYSSSLLKDNKLLSVILLFWDINCENRTTANNEGNLYIFNIF